MLITNKAQDSLTDENDCKHAISYVLSHNDARIKGEGEVVIILHFKVFPFHLLLIRITRL